MPGREHADVVVVGSGAGGATVAGALARAGLSVTVIEAGPLRTARLGDHVRNSNPGEEGIEAFAAALDRHLVYPSEASEPIPGLAGYKVAHGVGGMLTFWTNNCPRPHRDELPAWVDAATWEVALDRAYALIGARADVFGHGVRSRRLLAAARAAVGPLPPGREVQPMPVAARWENGRLHYASVADLLTAGGTLPNTLDLRTDLIVHSVRHAGRRALGVSAHARDGHATVEIDAEAVVVAAGTVGTPKLLVASEIDTGPALGTGIFDHPAFSSRVALKPELADDVPANDPPFSIWIPYSPEHPWHNQLCRFPLNASPLPVEAPPLATADIFTWIPMDIEPENRLIFHLDRRDAFGLPQVSAKLRPSQATCARAARGLAEHYLLAAALGDLSIGWSLMLLKPGESTHFMGSCRMGPCDDGTSVLDESGRLWAYDNLYVAGTCVLAQANAGNPTIMCIAAALRTADRILGHWPTT